jgi:hypothetical protein
MMKRIVSVIVERLDAIRLRLFDVYGKRGTEMTRSRSVPSSPCHIGSGEYGEKRRHHDAGGLPDRWRKSGYQPGQFIML